MKQHRPLVSPVSLDFDPHHPCVPGGLPGNIPSGIQISTQAATLQNPFALTTVATNPCTLWQIVHGNTIELFAYGDKKTPKELIPVLLKITIAHAQELWAKDLACPHPANGVAFSILIPPDQQNLLFPLADIIDLFLFSSPIVVCQ
jgi:hypothetical protein